MNFIIQNANNNPTTKSRARSHKTKSPYALPRSSDSKITIKIRPSVIYLDNPSNLEPIAEAANKIYRECRHLRRIKLLKKQDEIQEVDFKSDYLKNRKGKDPERSFVTMKPKSSPFSKLRDYLQEPS